MISSADLTTIFGYFGQGIVCGMILVTIFFILGFVISFLFDLIRRA